MKTSILFLKNLPLLLCISAFMLSSCAQYQYVSVNSNLKKTDKQEFVYENDTVMIKYGFAGQNFRVTVNVYNKMQNPLYVDWQRSTIVINKEQINGPFNQEGLSSFIAPQSHITVSSNELKSNFIGNNELVFQDKNRNPKNVNADNLHIAEFNEENSPLQFRSILALTSNENYSAPTFFDSPFYVSGIILGLSRPSTRRFTPVNQFYIRESDHFGQAIGWTCLFAILIAAAASGE